MRSLKTSNVTMKDGSTAVLSTTELPNGEFETMLATPDFDTEYAVLRTTSEAQALADHKHLRKQYHVAPLTGKYAKLSEDLRKAAEAGREVAKRTEDGGACNFDAATLYLKGWNRAKVEQAAKDAGVGCHLWNLWGSKSFVFPIPGTGQGDARSAAAEAMEASLKDAGYTAGMYYQID